jgi:hypothetical protein
MRNFPPKPAYPLGIDDNSTLYLVYNSTEAILREDNEPWADTVKIMPVAEDEAEIWPDNGFATINGELFYYDSVGKDTNDKVNELQKCLRNLGGEDTAYNPIVGGTALCPRPGTIVRGLVVAEHHNQIADAVLALEYFIGYNFDPDVETLDYRIRCLREVPICIDDFCITVASFEANIVDSEPDACVGIDLEYKIDIEGYFTQFTLDFGDGQFTTTDLEGTHTYAPNAKINPVAIIVDPRCQTVITPANPLEPDIPEGTIAPQLDIVIPEIPELPTCDIGDACYCI